MSEEKFVLVSPNRRYLFARFNSVIFLVVNAICMFSVAYQTHTLTGYMWGGLIAISAIAAYFSNKLPVAIRNMNLVNAGYFWTVFAWSIMHNYWIALSTVFVWVLHLSVKKAFEFTFTKDGIHINRLLGKEISWATLENVVLKDELLTVDFKNNKLMQAEINTVVSVITSEAEFNDFCRRQLAATHQ